MHDRAFGVPYQQHLLPIMRDVDTGAWARDRLTSKHYARYIPYDFFGKTCFLRVLQTRQTVGRYAVRERFTGLVITV